MICIIPTSFRSSGALELPQRITGVYRLPWSLKRAKALLLLGVDYCPRAARLFFVRKRARETLVIKKVASAADTLVPFVSFDWRFEISASIEAFGPRGRQGFDDIVSDCSTTHKLLAQTAIFTRVLD